MTTTSKATKSTKKGTTKGQKKATPATIKKSSKPDRLTLRSYQVGFGDCYLLTFHYGSVGRHVLIDFGSTGLPPDLHKDQMLRVAQDIRKQCGGDQAKLHVVVATHRHKDHISGFATNKDGDASGDIIRQCNPDVVIQPWTEDPKAKTDATKATLTPSGKSIAFTDTLLDMHRVAAAVRAEGIELLRFSPHRALASQLAFLGEDNLSNLSAVKNLMEMGKPDKQNKARRALYVNYDFDNPLDLSRELPGVTVRVLGPPTLVQSDKIAKMRSKDAAEFWQLQASAGKSQVDENTFLFSEVATKSASQLTPPYTRWFIRRMDAARGNQLLGLVRVLDSVMNNTSVILLFEAGDKKLLFPGDAQIENWNYALEEAEKNPQLKQLLQEVDVYKVGHHGSRNANPKSLWEMFGKRDTKDSPERLKTFVSTMSGKHGDPKKHTEVPRKSLVDALKKLSNYFTTQKIEDDELSQSVTIDL